MWGPNFHSHLAPSFLLPSSYDFLKEYDDKTIKQVID